MEKEKKEKEIKEEAKAEKTKTLPEEKQSKLKTLSKILYIFAKIAKVCILVGVVFVFLAAIILPVVKSNIRIEDNSIIAFGERLEYQINDDNTIDLMVKNTTVATLTDEEALGFNVVTKELTNEGLAKIISVAELALIIALAVMIVTYYVLDNSDKLFRNIYDKDTPFNEENVLYLRKIGYFLIAIIGIEFVFSVIGGAAIKYNIDIKFDLSQVAYVLMVFAISYIFEYGIVLQKDSKKTIYSEK